VVTSVSEELAAFIFCPEEGFFGTMITTCEITLCRNPENLIYTTVKTDLFPAVALSSVQPGFAPLATLSKKKKKGFYKMKARLTIAVFFVTSNSTSTSI
jgi:hypothetical protein